jgi:exodeoxyribonuclease V beta subunit
VTTTLDPLAIDLSGTTLIEASAGTGKTHAIATLFVRLLLEAGLTVDRILVVTFTEAAAAELRDRIRRRLATALAELSSPGQADPDLRRLLDRRREAGHDDAPRLTAAIRGFDLATISTIHGFCQGVLQRNAFETGVSLHTELIVDDGPLLEEIVRDFIARELYPTDPMFAAWVMHAKQPADRALRLVRLVVAHPDLPVLPQSAANVGALDRSTYDAAYGEVRRIWIADRSAITALLAPDKVLFKKHRENLEPTYAHLDSILRDPSPLALVDVRPFVYLARDTIERNTLKPMKDAGKTPRHPFLDACSAFVEAHHRVAAHLDARLLAFKLALVKYARTEAPKRKRKAAVQSFDDLLLQLRAALGNPKIAKRLGEQLRTRFGAALIDEFQDTDPVQYEIFRSIFAQRGAASTLLLIGDPKQAIYGFRGADIFAYLRAAQATGKRRVTMGSNWRSDPALLAGIEHLFAVRDPFVFEDIEFVPVAARPNATARLHRDGTPLPALELMMLGRDGADLDRGGRMMDRDWARAELPGRIAADIAALLASGAQIDEPGGPRPVHAGDVAVLTRMNVQALAVQAALRLRGIPSVVYGDSTVFETREADELAHVLGAVAEPTRVRGVRAALATEIIGLSATELADLDRDDIAWERWVDAFRRLREVWSTRGFVQMFRALLVETEAQRRLLALADGERRMTNLLHLAELLHAAASEQHLGPLGLQRWFAEQRRIHNTMIEAFKLRLERDDRAVQLITIHRSKGLEYPIVYCPYSWDGENIWGAEKEDLLYHTDDAEHRLELDVRPGGSPDKAPALALATREQLAESVRLLYVAITRARHRCVVVWPPTYRAFTSALGRLLWSTPLGQPPVDPTLATKAVLELDDDELLARLRVRAGDHFTVSMLPAADALAAPLASPPATATLSVRRPRSAIDRLFRTSSFSNLASAQALGGPLFVDFADAQAHDEALAVDATAAEVEWTTTRAPAGETVTLADFPRGVQAGNFFHDLIEHLDFAADVTVHRQHIGQTLRGHGLPLELATTVETALDEILDAPLLGTGPLCLRAIDRSARLDELEFLVPVAAADTALGRRALAQVFREHADGLPDGYAERVAALGFSPLRGFLKGFVDMVFVHEGRWWVVDYKTNHLGASPDDYGATQMARAMADDHYVLQYHLYVVAVVRMLALRLPGFDYERDFGGVLYLFLRGMARRHGDVGVWRERPPRSRIDALSRLLEHGAGADGGKRGAP